MLAAELEGVANGFLDDAGRRQHPAPARALGQEPRAGGGRRAAVYTFGAGTRGLIEAMAAQAPFAQWLSTPVDSLGAGAVTASRCARATAMC